MDSSQEDFLKIVSDIRTHLEYQRALGVGFVEISTGHTAAAAPDVRELTAPVAAAAPAAEIKTTVPASGLDAVRADLGDCTRCKLHKGRTTIVFGEGDPHAALVFVGEGPGQEEDQQGRPFVGAAGQLLTDIIEKGMQLKRQDVYICNIVKCRPPNNRNPEPDEVESCIVFVKKQIAAIRPRVIVTLGNVPTQNLLGTKQGITRMRGIWHDYEGIPVMPTFHPSYLLRSPGEKGKAWDDIKQVMIKLGLPVPEKK